MERKALIYQFLSLCLTAFLCNSCGQAASVKAEDLRPCQSHYFNLNLPSDWTIDSDSLNWLEAYSPDIFLADSIIPDSSHRLSIILDVHKGGHQSLQDFLAFHISDDLGAARVIPKDLFEIYRQTGKLERDGEESMQPEIYWHRLDLQYYNTKLQATEKLYFCYRDSLGIIARCKSPLSSDFERDGYLFDLIMQSFRWRD